MTALAAALAKYRAYHLDRRNVATHAIGIPMILLSAEVLLSRPQWSVADVPLTPAIFASALAAIYYLRLDLRFGLAMAFILALCAWAGLVIAQASTAIWLATGVGLFVIGWIFQLVGHGYEGRKPAFVDDLRSLLIGPLFVVAEAAFAIGLRPELRNAVEHDGP